MKIKKPTLWWRKVQQKLYTLYLLSLRRVSNDGLCLLKQQQPDSVLSVSFLHSWVIIVSCDSEILIELCSHMNCVSGSIPPICHRIVSISLNYSSIIDTDSRFHFILSSHQKWPYLIQKNKKIWALLFSVSKIIFPFSYN